MVYNKGTKFEGGHFMNYLIIAKHAQGHDSYYADTFVQAVDYLLKTGKGLIINLNSHQIEFKT